MSVIINSAADWKHILSNLKSNKNIGFVPTMGALHEGHLSLVDKCAVENDITVVSIFVNPTQFNDPNDLKNYPRNFQYDQKLLDTHNVDYIFYPDYKEIYHDNYRYKVQEIEFSKKLCGASREGHFDGVLTVVMKLLNIIEPNNAYFGEKDYQQYLLIDGMTKSFFMKTKIIPCQTVRSKDGLAHSSRNELLTPEQREIAPLFAKLLKSNLSVEEIKNELNKSDFKVDYIEDIGGRRFGAVWLGKVRLIDNVELKRN